MLLMVLLSGLFFFSIIAIAYSSALKSELITGKKQSFLPKSRTEMIKGIAAAGIVFSHIASYSKAAAPNGLLRYYTILCTTLGGVGVNLFFFISGYGNYFSLIKKRGNRLKWLLKRCAVLLIIYAVCLFIVLGVLYAGGYNLTLAEVFNEITHLTIPFSSVWYLKIQLLVYIFLALAMQSDKRSTQTIIVFALCVISTILLFALGLGDKWWKSTICFAAGAASAAYKQEIANILSKYRKSILITGIALFPFVYAGAVLVDNYPVKTVSNLLLCCIMIALVQLLRMNSRVYAVIGSYSLPLYLIHRSLVAWILDDGITTDIKVLLIVTLSIVLTLIAKWISDRIIKLIK